ncbi:MAG: hypothetical protein AAGE84_15070 [Cyanobacteria bacterium P01_G01_bin.39]
MYVLSIDLEGKHPLSLITSGKRDQNYTSKVLNFDWNSFFAESNGGDFIESLRNQWRENFDVILIDSRTGITDSGGICTIQLPDILVLVFTANYQSLNGVKQIALKAQQARQKLSYDRRACLVFPLPSRFDSRTEYQESQEWLRKFAVELKPFYQDWLPKKITPLEALIKTKLPYVGYFSFWEKLPVIIEGTSDPEGIGYAYQTAAALIANDFDFTDLDSVIFGDSISFFVNEEVKPKIDKILLGALSVLNVTSGYTTIKGALQIFPGFLGYFSGGVIQILLLLLVSGSTLRHAPKLKWLAVASFGVLSIYTSFFAYYEFLTGEEQRQSAQQRAETAHNGLIAEIYTPIENKIVGLESQIAIKAQRIENEITGNRVSVLPGCGDICQQLKIEREDLEQNLAQLSPVEETLQPLFKYDLTGKSPEEIFAADIRAIASVPLNCLPQDLEFDCLPEQYENLDPSSSQYQELRDRYLDQDSTYILLRPFHKIRQREAPAIAAGLLALMVDGLIIALGTGVEIHPQKKRSN